MGQGLLLTRADVAEPLTRDCIEASAAAVGVFPPVYLFVVVPFLWFGRISANPQAASGAIAGVCFVLARRAIVDVPTLLIGLVALGVTVRFKVPEPLLIGAGAGAGLAIFALRK